VVTRIVPVAVIIPTYNRGTATLTLLQKIQECDPGPAAVFIHVDEGNGTLEDTLIRRFPGTRVLTSLVRLGPGGGRHRCLQFCTSPYVVSFDDDSYPVDSDFFLQVERLFSEYPRAAIFGATIWHRHELEKERTDRAIRVPSFIGCGHAVRLIAYQGVRGYLPIPRAYGMEESDLSLQLFAAGWHLYEAGNLRVFHDTDLKHHQSPEITSGAIANTALYAFLHYPLIGWARGLMQLANKVVDSIRRGRTHGILRGILQIPSVCYQNRRYRKPVPWKTVKRFLRFRRTGIAQ
jgi:GT2 family glycosyltransferase